MMQFQSYLSSLKMVKISQRDCPLHQSVADEEGGHNLLKS
jgi:hypothetical protein